MRPKGKIASFPEQTIRVEGLSGSTSDRDRYSSPHVVVIQGELPRTTTLALTTILQCARSPLRKDHIGFQSDARLSRRHSAQGALRAGGLSGDELEFLQLYSGVSEPHTPRDDKRTQNRVHLSEGQLQILVAQFQEDNSISVLLITLGARGVYYPDLASGQCGLVPAVIVSDVVDTTAAGDTFVGYFAASLARHLIRVREGNGASSKLCRGNVAYGELGRCVVFRSDMRSS